MDNGFAARFVIQMLMCVLVGSVMGLTTRNGSRGAGPRTFILVTAGAALVTVVSTGFVRESPWSSDPGRIAAQVVSALGFIGTGLMFLADGQNVKRLWAAAALWVSAILGMVIGLGRLSASSLGLVVVVAVVVGLNRYLNRRATPRA